jgi:hypothetical protein
MSEIMRQREEALAALRRTAATVVRLRKLLREQDTYTPEALEQSVDDLMNEFFYTGRRLSARISVLVSLRASGSR